MEEKIALVNGAEERAELIRLAKRSVKKDLKFWMYAAFFVLLGFLFLAFAAYTVSLFLQGDMEFQWQMLIYVLVPLMGAVLSVVFILQRHKTMTEDRCEAEQAEVVFDAKKIAIRGLRKKQPENSVISRLLREEPKDAPEGYEIEIERIRYYAYDEETGRFRWIIEKQEIPDMILPQGSSLTALMEKLSALGIRRTGFID